MRNQQIFFKSTNKLEIGLVNLCQTYKYAGVLLKIATSKYTNLSRKSVNLNLTKYIMADVRLCSL